MKVGRNNTRDTKNLSPGHFNIKVDYFHMGTVDNLELVSSKEMRK